MAESMPVLDMRIFTLCKLRTPPGGNLAVAEILSIWREKGRTANIRDYEAAFRHFDGVFDDVNGGRIPGHRGGVKAGHWRWGAADMARAPIGALAISAVGIDQGMISPVSGSALSGVAWFCSAAAVARRRPADCLRR